MGIYPYHSQSRSRAGKRILIVERLCLRRIRYLGERESTRCVWLIHRMLTANEKDRSDIITMGSTMFSRALPQYRYTVCHFVRPYHSNIRVDHIGSYSQSTRRPRREFYSLLAPQDRDSRTRL